MRKKRNKDDEEGRKIRKEVVRKVMDGKVN